MVAQHTGTHLQVGHLRRELVEQLAPLLDRGDLQIEGEGELRSRLVWKRCRREGLEAGGFAAGGGQQHAGTANNPAHCMLTMHSYHAGQPRRLYNADRGVLLRTRGRTACAQTARSHGEWLLTCCDLVMILL